MLRTLLVLCLTITSFIMFNLGMDYINFDSGIHPLIAFPIALITLIGAYLLVLLVSTHTHRKSDG